MSVQLWFTYVCYFVVLNFFEWHLYFVSLLKYFSFSLVIFIDYDSFLLCFLLSVFVRGFQFLFDLSFGELSIFVFILGHNSITDICFYSIYGPKNSEIVKSSDLTFNYQPNTEYLRNNLQSSYLPKLRMLFYLLSYLFMFSFCICL